MATFAKLTFNASIYSASRPTYPQILFEHIFNYHKRSPDASWDTAIDVGCGTGQATMSLLPFHQIIGVDPSLPMVQQARAYVDSTLSRTDSSKFTFMQGSAETLDKTLDAGIADMLVVAQAAHWFDWTKVWPQVSKVLKPNGTAAFWVYSEFRLPKHPKLTPLITSFLQGTDPKTSLGPHFQRPGRTILERHLVDVPNPESILGGTLLTDMERVYFTGDYHPDLPTASTLPAIMNKRMRWRDLLGYLRSASALHTYHEKYPEDRERDDDPRFPEDRLVKDDHSHSEIDVTGGDISIRFWKDLRVGAKLDDVSVGVDDLLEVEWPLALLLVRKSASRASLA